MANLTSSTISLQSKVSRVVLGKDSPDVLLPKERFEIKSLKGINIVVHKDAHHVYYVSMKGFGIWDTVLKGWVSLGSTDTEGCIVPTSYTKKVATEAISGGLYGRYNVVYQE